MDFQSFAQAHGLDIRRLDHGKICRCPTADHSHKQNGAYLFMGDWGWAQNWGTQTEPEFWRDDAITKPADLAALRVRMEASRKQHAQERTKLAVAAAKRAMAIIGAAKMEQHCYLDAHGWKDEGLVYYPTPDVNLLVLPMRIGGAVAGCQLVDRDGVKKYLYGQRTIGAEFVFGSRGVDIWAEGWATARSISECLTASGLPARVHATFSAGNLQRMATSGFVVADHDASGTGERVAQATGLPYWMPPTGGQDYNDFHQEAGTFRAGMALRKFLQSARG